MLANRLCLYNLSKRASVVSSVTIEALCGAIPAWCSSNQCSELSQPGYRSFLSMDPISRRDLYRIDRWLSVSSNSSRRSLCRLCGPELQGRLVYVTLREANIRLSRLKGGLHEACGSKTLSKNLRLKQISVHIVWKHFKSFFGASFTSHLTPIIRQTQAKNPHKTNVFHNLSLSLYP